MSDPRYSERTLGLGSVFGVRLLLARLPDTFISYNGDRWATGVNVAECKRWEIKPGQIGVSPFEPALCRGYLSTECTCGFYACFDYWHICTHYSSIEYYIQPKAIIEGFGKIVVGSKGFRAEKARIVALFDDFDRTYVPEEHIIRHKRDKHFCMTAFNPERFESLSNIASNSAREINKMTYKLPYFDTYEAALAQFPLSKTEDFS